MTISVIVPIYNHFNEAMALIRSLEKQNFQDFECIIVNDGSENKLHPQFDIVIKNSKIIIKYYDTPHSGAAAARNFGAKQAMGIYLLFTDADIQFQPDALSLFESAIKNSDNNIAFIYSEFYFGIKKMKGIEFNAERLRKINYIHTTSLIKKDFFIGFDESLLRFQDWDLWLRITEMGGVGKLIKKPLFKIKTRKTGISKWVPAFFFNKPFIYLSRHLKTVNNYLSARKILEKKHSLKQIM